MNGKVTEEWLTLLLADAILQTEMRQWKTVIENMPVPEIGRETLGEFNSLVTYFNNVKTENALSVPAWRRGSISALFCFS